MTIKRLVITAILTLGILAVSGNAQERLVLCELFTNTSCGPCYNANLHLDTLAENHADEFILIRYHTSWPSSNDPFYRYNMSENTARTNYYNVDGVPTLKVDGFLDPVSYPNYWNMIMQRYYMESSLEITLDGYFDTDTRQGSLDITLNAIDDAYWDSLYLRIALVENNLHFNAPNGLNYHDQTMRDMIPNAYGTSFDISYGEIREFSQDFSCPSPLVIDNCELIIWVQSDYIKEIYQAARITLPDLAATSVDESVELPENFSLAQNYPNPFNAKTAIYYNLKNTSAVKLDIFDLAGRKVATLLDDVQPAGNHQVIWDAGSAASGIYFYHLTVEGNSLTKRMVLLK